ncbi:hypothetical protein, partial [Psychrobacter celer]|uniref:hypothetical protein n=1 Tax=Psychrobacter celer TaxID=306572 RepID=UPI003FCF6EBF
RAFKSFYVRYSPCQLWLSQPIPLRLSTHTTTSIDPYHYVYRPIPLRLSTLSLQYVEVCIGIGLQYLGFLPMSENNG